MRQWIGVLTLALAVCAMAIIMVGSSLAVADATSKLQVAFDGIDDGLYGDAMTGCDPLDTTPCY